MGIVLGEEEGDTGFLERSFILVEEFLMTRPERPESEMRTLEPLPRIVGESLFFRAYFRAWTSS